MHCARAGGGRRRRGEMETVQKKLQVKKIPVELRRRRIDFNSEPRWYRRILWRLKEDSQFQRSAVQAAFVLLCVWIGVEFHLFMKWGQSGGQAPYVERPPGVEGFLPIGALISMAYWAGTGIINSVHPSGLAILCAIVAVSLVVKKAFCSWLCPIGTLSEGLWRVGRMLFKRNFSLPRWLDYPLRSIKYLLMAFFVWSIMGMDVEQLMAFIYSPYNKMADVKMYLFFAELSAAAFWTILALMLFSLFVKNFWCRFLCPYGALLGIVSLLGQLKITRNKATCVDCELCTKACPSNIKVHTAARVLSDECMSCMECVAVCPVKDTLNAQLFKHSKPVPTWMYGMLVVGVFVAVTGLAMLLGRWQNNITPEEYLQRFPHLDSSLYQHARGEVPQYGPND
jgi:polyferredoxin